MYRFTQIFYACYDTFAKGLCYVFESGLLCRNEPNKRSDSNLFISVTLNLRVYFLSDISVGRVAFEDVEVHFNERKP